VLGISPESKGGRCVELTALPPSCAVCLEIWGVSSSWNPQSLPRPTGGFLLLFYYHSNFIFVSIINYLTIIIFTITDCKMVKDKVTPKQAYVALRGPGV
jgi:hypothetical protein